MFWYGHNALLLSHNLLIIKWNKSFSFSAWQQLLLNIYWQYRSNCYYHGQTGCTASTQKKTIKDFQWMTNKNGWRLFFCLACEEGIVFASLLQNCLVNIPFKPVIKNVPENADNLNEFIVYDTWNNSTIFYFLHFMFISFFSSTFNSRKLLLLQCMPWSLQQSQQCVIIWEYRPLAVLPSPQYF